MLDGSSFCTDPTCLLFAQKVQLFFSLKEIALHLIGQLTDSHLTVCGSSEDQYCSLQRGVHSMIFATIWTVSAGLVAFIEAIGEPGGVAFLFAVPRRMASPFPSHLGLAYAWAQRPLALGNISAQGLAEVGLEAQVDHRVIKGGGLGKHCCNGKRHRRDHVLIHEGRPHGHGSIWTPCHQEANTYSHRELGGVKTNRNTSVRYFFLSEVKVKHTFL